MPQNQYNVLDILFILFLSAVINLFILWSAAQISGHELFEALPDYMTNGVTVFWTFLSGAGIGILRSFLQQQSTTENLSKPLLSAIAITTFIFLLAIFFITLLFVKLKSEELVGGVDVDVDLTFDLKFKDGSGISYDLDKPINLSFFQLSPEYSKVNLAKYDDNRYHVRSIDMPRIGKNYVANFRPIPQTSSKQNQSPETFLTSICFKYKKNIENKINLNLTCIETESCNVNAESLNFIGSCSNNEASLIESFSLVRSAHASSDVEAGSKAGWIAPSLNSLRKMTNRERVGYTVFNIRSEPMAALAQASILTFEVMANETPVYFDGWPTKYNRVPFNPQKGINIDFALENLNFSGSKGGEDEISILIEFFDSNDNPIIDSSGNPKTLLSLKRRYVPLRDAEIEKFNFNEIEITWEGKYIVAKNENKYEVMILSSFNKTATSYEHKKLSSAGMVMDGLPIVSILRPPRDDNNSWGVSVGIVQDTGQIKFTYNKEEAKKMCAFVLEQRKNPALRFIREDSFRYEVEKRISRPCSFLLK